MEGGEAANNANVTNGRKEQGQGKANQEKRFLFCSWRSRSSRLSLWGKRRGGGKIAKKGFDSFWGRCILTLLFQRTEPVYSHGGAREELF